MKLNQLDIGIEICENGVVIHDFNGDTKKIFSLTDRALVYIKDLLNPKELTPESRKERI